MPGRVVPGDIRFPVVDGVLPHHGEFTRDELEAKITAFTIRYNKTARPYRWSYDAGAEHVRYLERHPRPEAVSVLP